MRDFVKKTVIINRAAPGSGKTTITKNIVNCLSLKNISTSIHSTDDFFMIDGKYVFDINNLNAYHKKNLFDFEESLNNVVDVVICDNINIAPWHTKPYSDKARKYGYKIILITFTPRELKKHIESQKVTKEKPDAHNVPEEELKRFILEYYIYDPLVDERNVRNSFLHKNYMWNEKKNIRQKLPELSPYFDFDKLITIFPNEYHQVKSTIGNKIYELIMKDLV